MWPKIGERVKQIRRELQRKPKICLTGAVGTGKSSLFNAIFGEQLAETSNAVTTKQIQWGTTSTFDLGDLPGYGAIGGRSEEDKALQAMRDSDLVILVLQAVAVPTIVDKGLYDHIVRMGKPFVIAVNKIDLVNEQQLDEMLNYVRANFDEDRAPIIPVSATEAWNVDDLCEAVCQKLGEALRVPFIRSVQDRRVKHRLVNRLIVTSSLAAAGLGVNPLPFSDLYSLWILQASLVTRIGLAYGYEVSPETAQQFLAAGGFVGGAGWGFRALFRQMAKWIPGAGVALNAAVAAAGTMVIGFAAKKYFGSGLTLSPAEAWQWAKDRHRPLFRRLRGLKKERSMEKRREAIEEAVDDEAWDVEAEEEGEEPLG